VGLRAGGGKRGRKSICKRRAFHQRKKGKARFRDKTHAGLQGEEERGPGRDWIYISVSLYNFL